MKPRHAIALATLLVAGGVAGCGGDGAAGSPDGLPRFVSGYAAACTDDAGFGGAPAYDPDEAPFPIAFLYRNVDVDTFFVSDTMLGEGRGAAELSDPDDAGEQARLAEISVVGCLDVQSSEPSGATCQYEDDGNTTDLDVLDVTYEVTLHEAATGVVIGTSTFDIDGTEDTCPIVMSVDDGQSTFLPSADAEQLDPAVDEALDS